MNTLKSPRETLTQMLCHISDPNEMQAVLESILTQNELQEVDNRLRIFHMLSSAVPQREIAKTVGVGIATVSRGAAAFRDKHFLILKRYLDAADLL